MQVDLGEVTKVNGVVTQARANNCCGTQVVTGFSVQYSTDGVTFDTVPGGPLAGPTAEDFAADTQTKVKAFFPAVVTARYIRLVVESSIGSPALRAGVLLHTGGDMYSGKHKFRRCLETDGYTRVIAPSPLDASAAANWTLPDQFTQTVSCPGCYQCREMKIPPWTGQGQSRFTSWTLYQPRHGMGEKEHGFQMRVDNPGAANATLTVWLPGPVGWAHWTAEDGWWTEYRLTWEHHSPEFICRIDPAGGGGAPAEPNLDVDTNWVTFLKPLDGSPEAAIAEGFQLPETALDLQSRDQANLAAVYPPGAQVDPTATEGYASRDWLNASATAAAFVRPPQHATRNGTDGAWWPPKPTVQVTFQPPVDATIRYWTAELISSIHSGSEAAGWHVDTGGLEGDHVNGATGETQRYGWRCTPKMAWWGQQWRETDWMSERPVWTEGATRDIGMYHVAEIDASFPACPDGRPNAWEATVPNGIYMVTLGTSGAHSNIQQLRGCAAENVRSPLQLGSSTLGTFVLSVEVLDGRFTLTGGPSTCANVNWIKLDLITSEAYPAPWLPAPEREWWQLELDDADARVGLVQIRLPHGYFRTAESYPNSHSPEYPDCRKGWLWAPAKCYRQYQHGVKVGPHPDLSTYPDFPGFTPGFLGWLFDQHDTNGDGVLLYDEFRDAADALALSGPFAFWFRPVTNHNIKGTKGFHDDNVGHLWFKTDVIDANLTDGATHGDGQITRDEWVHGPLSLPRPRFCDLFETSAHTHGGNIMTMGVGAHCMRYNDGQVVEHWGPVADDGEHGFQVTVSDVPCTDAAGCPAVGEPDTNTTLCATSLQREDYARDPNAYGALPGPAEVDCGGATGRYVQIRLPGAGRLLPTADVVVHRTTLADRGNTSATNSELPTVCYAVEARAKPAADDPDLLAGAKLHPKQIVSDNPEDPIFWSTCYERVIVKEWLPLLGAGAGAGATSADAALPYAYLNRTRCLDCESVAQNLPDEAGYDMAAMITPRWWLQPDGQCIDCTAVLFNASTAAPTTSPTTAPTVSPTTATADSAAPTAAPTAPTTGPPGGAGTCRRHGSRPLSSSAECGGGGNGAGAGAGVRCAPYCAADAAAWAMKCQWASCGACEACGR